MEEKLNKIYEKIADNLNQSIPEEWDKVYMYGEVNEHMQNAFFYYYPSNSDKPVYSLDIPELFEIPENKVNDLRHKLLEIIEELWNEFKNNGQEPWTNFTFVLESNGKFKIDYDYTDLSEASPREQRWIWKYKYLGIMPENEKGKKVIEEYIKSAQNHDHP
jgi:uncharacterized protein (TIGR01741 family)